MAKPKLDPADYIVPLNMNGLQGRMLHLPAKQKKSGEILFVYGHHSNLERWWGLMLNLNRLGAVTMPDLPGMGGMDSYTKIGVRPDIDHLADYLAAFIKMRYKRRRVVIAGMSLGFVIVTRMLQRYPDLAKKVDIVVSLAGFAHKDDFVFSKPLRFTFRTTAGIIALPGVSSFFRHVILHPFFIKTVYRHTLNAKDKFKGVAGEDLKELIDFEIRLWHENDVRTHFLTNWEFLGLDNTRIPINLPVYHIAVAADRYFDNSMVEQHLRQIYTDFHLLATLDVANHAPSVLADAKAAAPFVPARLRKVLAQLDKKK